MEIQTNILSIQTNKSRTIYLFRRTNGDSDEQKSIHSDEQFILDYLSQVVLSSFHILDLVFLILSSFHILDLVFVSHSDL